MSLLFQAIGCDGGVDSAGESDEDFHDNSSRNSPQEV